MTYQRVFISLTPEQARALEERRVREHRRTLSDTARAILDEALEKEIIPQFPAYRK